MKHTKSLLESEVFRLQKSIEKQIKDGELQAVTEYYKEIVSEYSASLKILNECSSVAEVKEKLCPYCKSDKGTFKTFNDVERCSQCYKAT